MEGKPPAPPADKKSAAPWYFFLDLYAGLGYDRVGFGKDLRDRFVFVAKLDIASDSDSEGRGFESRRIHRRPLCIGGVFIVGSRIFRLGLCLSKKSDFC